MPSSVIRCLLLVLGSALLPIADLCAQGQILTDDIHRPLIQSGEWSYYMAPGDFDGDGDLDLFARQGAYLNDGHANFELNPCLLPDQYLSASEPKVADLDGDFDLDLVWPSKLWLNDGRGCFSDASSNLPALEMPGLTIGLAIGDVDADGDQDLVLPIAGTDCTDRSGGSTCVPGYPRLLLNDGLGRFVDASVQVAYRPDGSPRTVLLGDLDGDRDLDLFVGNIYDFGWDLSSYILENDGQGFFLDSGVAVPPSSWVGSYDLTALADLDSDGDLDVLFGDPRVWWNVGQDTFVDGSLALPHLMGATFAALADFDSDSDIDLIATRFGDESLFLRNDGAGQFSVELGAFAHVYGPVWMTTGDLDSDHDVDVIGVTHEYELHLNDGQGRFRWLAPLLPSAGGYRVDHACADFDGDRDLDLYEIAWGQDVLALQDGSGTFQDATRNLPGEVAYGYTCAASDVDLDGDQDVFVVELKLAGAACTSKLLMNDGTGTFAPAPDRWSDPAGTSHGIAAGDVDGDGDPDLVSVSSGQARPKLFVNDGSGYFAEQVGLGFQTSYAALRVAPLVDLDGDGDLDVAMGWVGAQWFANDGTGRFGPGVNLVPGNIQVEDLAVADFELDGDPDIAVSVKSGPKVLINDGHGTFTTIAVPWGNAEAWALDFGDVNGDGLADLLVAQYGSSQDPTDLRLILADGLDAFTDVTSEIPRISHSVGEGSLLDTDDDGDLDAVLSQTFSRSRILVNVTRQLAWEGRPRIGAALELGLWGPHDRTFLLMGATERAFVPLGELGTLRLDRTSIVHTLAGQIDPLGRAHVEVEIPNDWALVGTELYWQALFTGPRKLSNLEITRFDAY